MDKNAIKKFAVWARRELISRVSQKALQYGITEDSIVPATATSVNGVVLSNDEIKQRRALIEKISDKGYQHVIEEVAYTWFNRFIALRFMEVNGYLPSHVRVFTDDENNFKPQILTEAINLDLDGLDLEKVYELKDANDNEGLFKYLLIVQCNAFNPIMPRMFQKISDYTELLFPDNLLREGSVVQQMIELIPEEDWKDAVQIIGWLYQYYNSEKKDDVFNALKKNVKVDRTNIPAATQLFTPDWIVRYMVENSLGRFWLEGHREDKNRLLPTNKEITEYLTNRSELDEVKWYYYLDEKQYIFDSQNCFEGECKEYINLSPEEIRVIDPCSGSGHILVYIFDVLMRIYENRGYSTREAVASIIENNIYGLDIDERASQLAYFAVVMKARQYDRRFFSRGIQPHVYSIKQSNSVDKYALDYFCNGDTSLKISMETIIRELHDAEEYGSILTTTKQDWDALYRRFDEINEEIHITKDMVLEMKDMICAAQILSQKYHVAITNPPYLNFRNMNSKLLDYCNVVYPNSKADLFGVFIERLKQFSCNNGFFSMITMQNWMYIDSFDDFRKKVLPNISFVNLLHLGMRAFDAGDVGTIVKACTFVMKNSVDLKSKAIFINLREENTLEKEIGYLKILKGDNLDKVYINEPAKFLSIPNSPIAYAFNQGIFELFERKTFVAEKGKALCGIQTGDNARFLRLWFEVDINNIALDITSRKEFIASNKKWASQIKGGYFRKWYGNLDYIINIYNDGYEISHAKGTNFRLRDPQNYFLECLTWSHTSDRFGVRFLPAGNLCNVEAPAYFLNNKENKYKLLAFLNSKVAEWLLAQMDDSLHFSVSDILGLPYIDIEIDEKRIIENIMLSKEDWDESEISWDFKKHPLIGNNTYIEDAYFDWKEKCRKRFERVKENEEYFNKMYINAFGLYDQIDYQVDEKNISLTVPTREGAIKSLISYAVGCMFGRYSLDKIGLVCAGGEWNSDNYKSYDVDLDNIIPICDDEYFEDDIVGRFVEFIKIVFGTDSLDTNLNYIANTLGGKGSSREIIRNYFMNDFFKEHCARCSVSGSGKRPIYWLFDSGKKNGFKALVYMHRYQPDTIARMRTDYVHEQQSRYRTAIADLEQRIASATTSERVKLNKKLKTLNEQAAEIQIYEEKIHHLADQYISIDLDDGVKKNYEIFKDVLAKIK